VKQLDRPDLHSRLHFRPRSRFDRCSYDVLIGTCRLRDYPFVIGPLRLPAFAPRLGALPPGRRACGALRGGRRGTMQDVLAAVVVAVPRANRGSGERRAAPISRTCHLAKPPDLPPALLGRGNGSRSSGNGRRLMGFFPPSQTGAGPQLLLVLVTRYKTNGYLAWSASSPKGQRIAKSSCPPCPDDSFPGSRESLLRAEIFSTIAIGLALAALRRP